MMDQTDKVKKLTTLMCYLRAGEYFESELVHFVQVTWFHWGHTWRCTVRKVYKQEVSSTTISNNPLCNYIISECFTPEDMVTIDVLVNPPNSHQVMEASFQLAEMLGSSINIDELLL